MKAFMKQVTENNYLSFCNNGHRIVHPCKETGAELQDIDVALRVVGAAAVKSLDDIAFDSKINNDSKVFFLNSQCFNGCPQEIADSASFEDFLLLLGHEHMKDDVGTKGLQRDIESGSNLSCGIGLKLGLDVNYGYILVVIFF
ncbi:hypothetical protein KIW84_042295 [Lathyrus oleraceus]|uniref:Uncharacterized protein n=1 Tax=Pisum sativum TaxID=3888 RepID=A0A9D4XAV1_PEA|nr:hypothetical protein KIW84_042288 [Pisum sativum]KAI5417626.1 hypothetical protein KIW84_042295 [Pisum sativum]